MSPPSADVLTGIGDDAAVVRFHGGKLLVTTDTMVEGIHFLESTITPHNLGYKALAVSISDIAAMGGSPTVATVSIAIPPKWSFDAVGLIYDGFNEIGQQYGCDVVGGDVVAIDGPLVVTTTVLGRAETPVLRSGAAPGDILFVTGSLGGSAAGLEVLLGQARATPVSQAILVNRHQRPQPRVTVGMLAANAGVSALNDISDGLASELHEVAGASSVRCVIEADLIPILPEAKEQGRAMGKSALDYALYGGEDFELVGAAPRHAFARLLASAGSTGVPITAIGRCEEGDGVVMRTAGHLEVIEPRGYNHFKR